MRELAATRHDAACRLPAPPALVQRVDAVVLTGPSTEDAGEGRA